MKIGIDYVAYLDIKMHQRKSEIELEDATSIKRLLEVFAILESHRKFIIPIVNGNKEKHSYILKDGDSVFLHLPAGGG
jgi:hypothetical protein